MADGESDWPIVLGDGRAAHRGKGPAVLRSLQRKHKPGVKDWTNLCKPHCWEWRTKRHVTRPTGSATCLGCSRSDSSGGAGDSSTHGRRRVLTG
jgi:hypothetical protein